MNPIDIKKLYEKQISLTEWFEDIGHADTDALRTEDNDKRERLRVLRDAIGLPFDAPTQFRATDVSERTPVLQEFLRKHGDELCALRLIPLDPSLPKLRMRGATVNNVLDWYAEQHIDPEKYRAEFMPHAEKYFWSTIFVVNEHGAYGEIIAGAHHQLTQGFHDVGKPIAFSFDFETVRTAEPSADAVAHLQEVLTWLRIKDNNKRAAITSALNASFVREYLCGYFETVVSKDFGLWFVDYNRILGEKYRDFQIQLDSGAPSDGILRGMVGSPGRAVGKARIITGDALPDDMKEGDILVCAMTTPAHVPLMKKAAAIVTDLGGILTHAAIVARELKKPCVVGTKNATQVFQEGDMVEVDADRGVIRKM